MGFPDQNKILAIPFKYHNPLLKVLTGKKGVVGCGEKLFPLHGFKDT